MTTVAWWETPLYLTAAIVIPWGLFIVLVMFIRYWLGPPDLGEDVPVHTCHAISCTVPVPPKMWGCKAHWYMVPKFIRDKIWEYYKPGQEKTKDPSVTYLYWFHRARLAVAEKEGQTNTPEYRHSHRFTKQYERTRKEGEDE